MSETQTTAEEREAMLRGMHAASDRFYASAIRIGCHPFIEFAGLMNEYIKICEGAHRQGFDFTESSAHSGKPLPMRPFEASYLGEKLGCIYGPSLQEPENLRGFLRAAGLAKAARAPRESFDDWLERIHPAESKPAPIVHVLQGGVSFCNMPDVPGAWPAGHVWVAYNDRDNATAINCGECLRVRDSQKEEPP